MDGPVHVSLLGTIEVVRAGEAIRIVGAKIQTLLALLALASPHPVAIDRLGDWLWDDDDRPANPTNALQQQVAALRRVGGHDTVVRDGPGYRLSVEPEHVDVLRFERLVGDAQALLGVGANDEAARGFEAALALARGDALRSLDE